jgi:VWFA-related protein
MNWRIGSWCAVFLLAPGAAFAQQEVAPAQGQSPPLKLRSEAKPAEGRIHLDVVVTDKKGKPVTGLDLKDFTLLDDTQPAKILSFHAIDAGAEHGDSPAEVILLLDAVNLNYLELVDTRDEVAKFLRENGGHLAEPVTVALFTDDGMKRLLGPSTDGNALAAQLDQAKATFRTIGRSAGVNGASERFNLSIKWLVTIAESLGQEPGRKLLVWLSPGWPMMNRADTHTSPQGVRLLFDHAVDISTTLREAHIEVDSVSLAGTMGDNILGADFYESFLKGAREPDKIDSGNLNLKVVAVQSGGRAMSPDNDLAAQIRSCVGDAGAFYTLSFDPPKTERADEYHDLKVVVDRPKLTARTSTGYYNQP